MQERQVQPQHVLPREDGHQGYGSWRWLHIIGEQEIFDLVQKGAAELVGDGREEEGQETKVLNRIIRIVHEGWHLEADHRHGSSSGKR